MNAPIKPDVFDVPRCLEHGWKLTFCPVARLWSATDVMRGCGCVLSHAEHDGIVARVRVVQP